MGERLLNTTATVTIARNGRLEMYRSAANTPAFWEAQWRAAPPLRMRNQPIPSYFRHLVERYLPRSGRIIEAGCGNGNTLRTFSHAGYTIEGIDFAPDVIQANVAIDPGGLYRVGDVRALPHDTASLDGYISLGVIEHFDDATRPQILAEAARVLRPGGIAMISTPYFSPLRRGRAALGRDRPRTPAPDPADFYQFFFSGHHLRSMLREAGLQPIATDTYDTYKGIKDTIGGKSLLDRLRGLGQRAAAVVENAPRPIRSLAGHMVIVVARKPGAPPAAG